MSSLGFKQIIDEPTHIEGGHLDQIYVRGLASYEVELYSPYYTALDHDALCLVLDVQETGIIKIGTTWLVKIWIYFQAKEI